jgi:membrane-associated phospholipid phosphatase
MQMRVLASSLVLIMSCGLAKADSIQTIGDVLFGVIPVTAFASTVYMDDAEGRQQFYPAFLSNAAATAVLKYTVKRERPDGSDNYSFPSGHTSIAFQGAAFIHKRYGIEYAAPAYILATFVGYSRVESNKHHTSDVLAGALLGIASSFYFVDPYTKAVISPEVTKGYYGVNLAAQW